MKKNNNLLQHLYKVATEGWEKQPGSKTSNTAKGLERRKYLRVEIENLSVDVADGVGFFQGMVADISRFGVRMTDLPKRLKGGEKIMTIVVSGKGKHFKMNVKPRWHSQGGVMKSVGVEIVNMPQDWMEFVKNFEPILPKDIWADICL